MPNAQLFVSVSGFFVNNIISIEYYDFFLNFLPITLTLLYGENFAARVVWLVLFHK